jgi:hypothetical protein
MAYTLHYLKHRFWVEYNSGIKKTNVGKNFFLRDFFYGHVISIQPLQLIPPGFNLTYAKLDALPVYSNFIYGFFSQHITPIVFSISVGQFFIALGLVLNKNWTKLACIGGIIFGLAIAPLGVGSAFPSTVSMAVAFYILLKKYEHDFIWKLNQYKPMLV